MSNTESSDMDINLEKVNCPQCNEKMPTLRIPKNINQFMWGGWTCPKCNYKMDKFGNRILDK